MAQNDKGTRFKSDSQEDELTSRPATSQATPMIQTRISRQSAQMTRQAAKRAGKHDRKRRVASQRHVPVVAFVVVAIAVMGAFSYWFTHQVLDKQEPTIEPGLEVTITIPDGAGGAEISEILVESGVISDTSVFFKEVRNQDAESSMKSGTYDFMTGANVRDVVRQLVEGPNSTAGVITIPEGYTVQQIAAAAEEKLGISAEDFMNRAVVSNYINDFPFLAEANDDSLEGFLFPKTYDLGGKDKSADNLIRMMLSQYAEETGTLDYEAARQLVNDRYGVSMSDYEFLILASIIEKEAFSGDDWVNVSSTFYNRLAEGSLLQSDATMGYVTGGEVTADDLEIDSPYNTYYYLGLPPTPICNPSLQSLQAALNPAETNYYYFLIVEQDGYSYHAFSEDYDQHLEAINKVESDLGVDVIE